MDKRIEMSTQNSVEYDALSINTIVYNTYHIVDFITCSMKCIIFDMKYRIFHNLVHILHTENRNIELVIILEIMEGFINYLPL